MTQTHSLQLECNHDLVTRARASKEPREDAQTWCAPHPQGLPQLFLQCHMVNRSSLFLCRACHVVRSESSFIEVVHSDTPPHKSIVILSCSSLMFSRAKGIQHRRGCLKSHQHFWKGVQRPRSQFPRQQGQRTVRTK